MFNAVQDFTLSIIPGKKRASQSGWLSFNAVCCTHNGDSQDTRQRGGIKTNSDGGVSYHCFNCQFKTSYQPGRPLSFKFRKLLSWMGADKNDIQHLVIDALRIKDLVAPNSDKEFTEEITFTPRTLPEDAQTFDQLAANFANLTEEHKHLVATGVEYVHNRHLDMTKYEYYWTPQVEHKLSHRVIFPFYYKNQIVGYTARAFNDGIKPKYHSNHPANFVFNLDKQLPDNKFVIVVEGPTDAMSIDGVSVQTNEISLQQAELIEALGKQVIVVPDFDKHTAKNGKEVWPGEQMIAAAIEYGWHVSFPVWLDECKDVNTAVVKYGKLFVLKSILAATETSSLKIKLRANKI